MRMLNSRSNFDRSFNRTRNMIAGTAILIFVLSFSVIGLVAYGGYQVVTNTNAVAETIGTAAGTLVKSAQDAANAE